MHCLSAPFQRRTAPRAPIAPIAPIALFALIALFGCDRQTRISPTDSAGTAVGTVLDTGVAWSPSETAVPAGEPPPDGQGPARPTSVRSETSRPPPVRAGSPATTPPATSAAALPRRDTAPAADSTAEPTTGGAPPRDGSAPPQDSSAPPAAVSSAAVSSAAVSPPAVSPPARRQVPFAPGEKLTYDVRFGPLKVGTGTMEVSAIDTVRGREVYHTSFRIKGGTIGYKVNDRYESWFDTQSLVSLRYRQDIDEGSYERERTYEIFPERAVFSENGKTEQASVTEPLDDGSFIYFIRSIPLEVGKTYEFNRYFRPDRNPVTIRVLRRERVRVPAGSFDAVVVRPVIKAKGIFSEGGRAELWLADDSTRVMLQLKSKLSFGSLNLYLTRIRRP